MSLHDRGDSDDRTDGKQRLLPRQHSEAKGDNSPDPSEQPSTTSKITSGCGKKIYDLVSKSFGLGRLLRAIYDWIESIDPSYLPDAPTSIEYVIALFVFLAIESIKYLLKRNRKH